MFTEHFRATLRKTGDSVIYMAGKSMKIAMVLFVSLITGMACTQLNTVAAQDGTLNIRNFGAAGDGHADDTPALRQALGKVGEQRARIVIPQGTFRVSGITIPDGVTLVFRNGGKLLLPDDADLQINGTIEAGIVPIFTGEGTVTGQVDNLYVYPQWFGARGDGVHDDAAALQNAADLASESLGYTLFIPAGEYLFKEDVVIRSNVENRGLLVKEMEIDEERTRFSNFTFVPTHYPKQNPLIVFAPDHEEKELVSDPFYGVKEGDFKVPVYDNVDLADGSGVVDLAPGGMIRFYSSDFFSSRNNQKGDQYYDKNDVSQLVSGRGEVFPEFAFSYTKPPGAERWQKGRVYQKGDYCTFGGEIFKATWPSGPETVFEDRFLGTVDIGPVQPEPGETTTDYEFVFDNGSEDDINIWRRVDLRVWYREKDRPTTINGFRMEVRLKGHKGESKRLSAGAVQVNRSNMTFNDLEISVRDREATMSRLLNSNRAVNLEFNNAYISGATYHGLGYNILNFNVANVRYNDCISTNSRKGLDGRHGKNITIDGGFYNVINDHYGRNYLIRDVTMSGRSTHIPGYVTPEADLQQWGFRAHTAFGFSGANVQIENVTIDRGAGGGVLAARGDIGDLYGKIVLKNITIRRNEGDVRLLRHSIDPEFDYAGAVKVPDRLVIENVTMENPGRLTMDIGRGFDEGSYGPVEVRNSGPIGDVYSTSASTSFSGCRFENADFEIGSGSFVNLRHCTFSGTNSGLSRDNIGKAIGNTLEEGAEANFPVNYLNGELYRKTDNR